jgi:phosphomannomutase
MKDLIEKISKEVNEFQINNADDLERFRSEFLGKKGAVTLIFEDFKNLPKEDKKEYGQVINILKKTAQQKYDANKNLSSNVKKQVANLDLSMPSHNTHNGSQHPLSIVKDIKPKSILSKIKQRYKKENLSLIDGVKIDFEKEWVHVRPSNTEPILRIYTESTTQIKADKLAEKLKKEVQGIIKAM